MDYRILFVYSDASTREMYAATATDAENIVVQEMKAVLPRGWSFVAHVSNIALTEPPQL